MTPPQDNGTGCANSLRHKKGIPQNRGIPFLCTFAALQDQRGENRKQINYYGAAIPYLFMSFSSSSSSLSICSSVPTVMRRWLSILGLLK